ncbi:MAG: DNA-directed RNA polymerase subunit omega [Victivallales bacterium]|nr:DNA-directed RNA polymerase subunit omega [Victivallales bacterium]
MDEKLLEQARAKVDDVRLFINGVSKRASQLAKGARKLVALPPDKDPKEVSFLDIALREVAEGKVIITQGEEVYETASDDAAKDTKEQDNK